MEWHSSHSTALKVSSVNCIRSKTLVELTNFPEIPKYNQANTFYSDSQGNHQLCKTFGFRTISQIECPRINARKATTPRESRLLRMEPAASEQLVQGKRDIAFLGFLQNPNIDQFNQSHLPGRKREMDLPQQCSNSKRGWMFQIKKHLVKGNAIMWCMVMCSPVCSLSSLSEEFAQL